ncbi:MAG: tRNA (N6-threonylcarbamoyladenosine(37)-N6)-methyltransferase TrmO [Desulfomonilaceae bacterium]
MKSVEYKPIGVIRSPFQDVEGIPIQPAGAPGVPGTIEMEPQFEPGLKDLSGFSHIILIYHFHASKGYVLEVKPFLDDSLRGVFATRAPRRPNPIGLSVVRLVSVEGCTLRIQDVDVLDGTPLLDIKPLVPEFDSPGVDRIGWLSGKVQGVQSARADDRFK